MTRGEPASARSLLERALNLRRSTLGEDHPETLVLASNLAVNLRRLGQHEQARDLAEDTLARRRILGEDHPDTLASANNLGDDHPRILISANNLAQTLRTLGQHEQARHLDEDTLTRLRRVLGDDHPYTLTSVNNLAADLRALGRDHEVSELEEWVRSKR